MKSHQLHNRQEFERYKTDLLIIKNRYLVESIKMKMKLLATKIKMSEKGFKPSES